MNYKFTIEYDKRFGKVLTNPKLFTHQWKDIHDVFYLVKDYNYMIQEGLKNNDFWFLVAGLKNKLFEPDIKKDETENVLIVYKWLTEAGYYDFGVK